MPAQDRILCRVCRRAFRAITPSHLIRRHRYDPEHPLLAYRRRFGVRQFLSPVSLHKKVEGIRDAAVRWRRWTPRIIVGEIRKLRTRGRPLHFESARRQIGLSYRVVREHFGSWEAAVRAAGIAGSVRANRRWGRRAVLVEIRRRKTEGGDLAQSVVAREDPPLLGIANYYWGTWRRALGAAGIGDLTHIFKHGRWSRGAIVREIHRRRKRGLSIGAADVAREDGPLFRAAMYHIGNWSAAVEAAGIGYETVRHPQGSRRPTGASRPACRCCR